MVTHFAPIHIYNQTTLRTEAFTQSSVYRAGILTQRGLCTEKLLYTDTFAHRGFYTKKFLHTDALYKDAFAHINKGT